MIEKRIRERINNLRLLMVNPALTDDSSPSVGCLWAVCILTNRVLVWIKRMYEYGFTWPWIEPQGKAAGFPQGEPNCIFAVKPAIVYVLVEASLLAARKMRADSFLPPGHTEDNKGRRVEECVKVVEGVNIKKIVMEERLNEREKSR